MKYFILYSFLLFSFVGSLRAINPVGITPEIQSTSDDDLRKRVEERAAPTFAKQKIILKLLRQLWLQTGNDVNAKNKFISENQDAFEELGFVIEDEKDATNAFVTNFDTLNKAINSRTMANAAKELATESYEKAELLRNCK